MLKIYNKEQKLALERIADAISDICGDIENMRFDDEKRYLTEAVFILAKAYEKIRRA